MLSEHTLLSLACYVAALGVTVYAFAAGNGWQLAGAAILAMLGMASDY